MNRELDRVSGSEWSVEQEKKVFCLSYDRLVGTLAEAMEVDEAKMASGPEAGFNYEDIMSWIGLVNFKGGNVPDIQANLSSERGRTITRIDVRKQAVIESADEKATKEQLIYSMALTEAKMKIIAEAAGEVYPAVAFQINDFRKEMEKVREEILRNKEERVSLNNIINMRSSRGAFLATTMVLAAAVIVICTKKPITETATEATRPTVALVQPSTETVRPAGTEAVTHELVANESNNLWGTYKVGKQEFGIIYAVKLINEDSVDERVRSSMEKISRYYGSDLNYCYLEIEGEKQKAIMPFAWSLDGEGRVAGRWMVWSMGEGGVLTLPDAENSDNLVFVGLSRLAVSDGKGVVIGPTRGYTVVPFIVLVDNTGWFIADLPNVEEGDYFIPINEEAYVGLEEFLTK